MFKKCWKKKPPVEQATGLLWQPIVEPKINWPTTQAENITSDIKITNGTSKQKSSSIDRSDSEPVNNNIKYDIQRIERLETETVDRPKFVKVVNNNVYTATYSESTSTEPKDTKIEENRPSEDVDTSTICKPDVIVDDNANHIETGQTNHQNTIQSTTENTFRGSSASVLSINSTDTILSTSSVQMTRRKGLRDDDEESVELTSYDITPEEQAIIKKALRENDFFMAVASNVIDDLAQYMTYREVCKGDIIMEQGDPGNSMYVSKKGEFKVQMHGQTIKTFKGGRLFGELAILYEKPRAATVTAMSNGSVWELPRQIFKKLNINANQRILEFLSKVPVINKANPIKLRKIAELCDNRYYSKDTNIIREGQKGDEFFLVKTGKAVVSKMGQGKIKTYTSGDYFGEHALLYDDDRRTATVTAIDYGVECLVLKRHDFNAYLGDIHKFLQEDSDYKFRPILPLTPPTAEQLAPYKPIKLDELKREKLLGEGGFGIVYHVKWNKQSFALKQLQIQQVHKNKMKDKVMNEKEIQLACDSPFIVHLYRTFHDDTCIYFLLEYCPRAELWSLIQKKKNMFTIPLVRFTAGCVLEALAYLHLRNCAYLDLKPENIFIDREGYPKIGDFGNAVKLKPGEQIFCFAGTPAYMAPEIFQHKGTDMAADYWAFGVLIYEMLFGRAPFDDKDDNEHLFANSSKGIKNKHFPPNYDRTAQDLIQRLIHVIPSRRLGCQRDGVDGVYKHDFFKEVDFEKLRNKKYNSPLLALYKRKK